MCSFFDPEVAEQCREDDAEEVKNKEGANFCDWFVPNPSAHNPGYVSAESNARSELDALFGGDDADDSDDDPATAADDLFR